MQTSSSSVVVYGQGVNQSRKRGKEEVDDDDFSSLPPPPAKQPRLADDDIIFEFKTPQTTAIRNFVKCMAGFDKRMVLNAVVNRAGIRWHVDLKPQNVQIEASFHCLEQFDYWRFHQGENDLVRFSIPIKDVAESQAALGTCNYLTDWRMCRPQGGAEVMHTTYENSPKKNEPAMTRPKVEWDITLIEPLGKDVEGGDQQFDFDMQVVLPSIVFANMIKQMGATKEKYFILSCDGHQLWAEIPRNTSTGRTTFPVELIRGTPQLISLEFSVALMSKVAGGTKLSSSLTIFLSAKTVRTEIVAGQAMEVPLPPIFSYDIGTGLGQVQYLVGSRTPSM